MNSFKILRRCFGNLKQIEESLQISLSEYNAMLQTNRADFYLQKCKPITKHCLDLVQQSLNENAAISLDVCNNIMLVVKNTPRLSAPYNELMFQMLLNVIQHHFDQASNLLSQINLNSKQAQQVLNTLSQRVHQDGVIELIQEHQLQFNKVCQLEDPLDQMDVLLSIAAIMKQFSNVPTNQPLDFTQDSYDFWIKNQQIMKALPQQFEDIKLKLQPQLDWNIIKGVRIPYQQMQRYLEYYTTELKLSDIQNQGYDFIESATLGSMLNSYDIQQCNQFYQYLQSIEQPTAYDTIYRLFLVSRIVDVNLLKSIEESIQSDQVNIMAMLQFYAQAPMQPPTQLCQIIRRVLTKQWSTSMLTWKLKVLGYLFRIEKLTTSPVPTEQYQIIDHYLLSTIQETITGLRLQQLNQKDKLMIYFLVNCYYRSDMLQPSFNTQFALQIKSYLRNIYENQPRRISKLQLSVEQALINLGRKYTLEELVLNCFVVDFQMQDTIIEVNGPSHYFTLIGDELPGNHVHELNPQTRVYESKQTEMKSTILRENGFKVINVAYFWWNQWEGRHERVLDDMLRGLSNEQILLFESQ